MCEQHRIENLDQRETVEQKYSNFCDEIWNYIQEITASERTRNTREEDVLAFQDQVEELIARSVATR